MLWYHGGVLRQKYGRVYRRGALSHTQYRARENSYKFYRISPGNFHNFHISHNIMFTYTEFPQVHGFRRPGITAIRGVFENTVTGPGLLRSIVAMLRKVPRCAHTLQLGTLVPSVAACNLASSCSRSCPASYRSIRIRSSQARASYAQVR